MKNICVPGLSCSPSYSITIRVEIENRIGMFARIAMAISSVGGDLGSVDIVRVEKGKIIRDVTVNAQNEDHEKAIVKGIRAIPGVKVIRIMDRTFLAHEGGKIEVKNKLPVRDRDDLSKVYTPGVARVCMDINQNKEHAYRYTIKGNSVAVVSDGTAVLGLGDIGPEAALPVMEGKAMIFKEFAGIDAFPIVLASKNVDEIVATVKNIAPGFGGINLEDFAAPHCFEVEMRLRTLLDIPVFHDDQHGTAVVALAALINVSRLLKRDLKKFKIIVVGAGAAGTAVTKIMIASGVRDIIVCDRAGALYSGRKEGMDAAKRELAKITNPRRVKGSISDAMQGADVFIGLSAPNVITADDIRRMAKNPVVFALANPDPEIAPEEALPLVRIMATGRSDYPNQINNMLGFPGIFRGLLDVRARGVNEAVKLAAARAIAHSIETEELHEDYIIPSPFDRRIPAHVAAAVAETARKTGLTK
ncbi:MAG TPA: NAD-dependent malic enzyme [Nitrospirota bacterium]|nr:NAD-dependent malic enzyme [Nitrospirota bacterium]